MLKKLGTILLTLIFFLNAVTHEAWTVQEIINYPANMAGGIQETSYLDISSFTIPAHLGEIRYEHKAGSKKFIIHIQDAHCNSFAQKKIAGILGYLKTEYGIGLINLEGGAGEYDLSAFKGISDDNIREEVANYYLNKGEINGAEFYAINSGENISLWGVEEKELYLKNLGVYRDFMGRSGTAKDILSGISEVLTSLMRKQFSPELNNMDSAYREYKSGKKDFKDYFLFIMGHARKRGIDAGKYPDLELVLKTLEAERSIDFDKADRERNRLIDELKKRLSKNDLKELALNTVDAKQKLISNKLFYEFLLGKAEKAKIDRAEYQSLDRYIRYIELYESIDYFNVTPELEKMEGEIKKGLFKNKVQEDLDGLSRRLAILDNMFSFSLTKRDYDRYLESRDEFTVQNITTIVDAAGHKGDLCAGIAALDGLLEKVAPFYEYSFKRDESFLSNIKFTKLRDGIESAVIITGGFHSDSLCSMFEKAGYSYISILPKFKSEEGYQNPYFELLSGKEDIGRMRIEKVLSGASNIQIASKLSAILGDAVYGKWQIDAYIAEISLRALAERGVKINIADRAGEIFPVEFPDIESRYSDREDTRPVVTLDRDRLIRFVANDAFIDSQIKKAFEEKDAGVKRVYSLDEAGMGKALTDAVGFLKGVAERSDGRFSGMQKMMAAMETRPVPVDLITGLDGFLAHAGGMGIHVNIDAVRRKGPDVEMNTREIAALLVHEILAGYGVSHEDATVIEGAFMDPERAEALLGTVGVLRINDEPVWRTDEALRWQTPRDITGSEKDGLPVLVEKEIAARKKLVGDEEVARHDERVIALFKDYYEAKLKDLSEGAGFDRSRYANFGEAYSALIDEVLVNFAKYMDMYDKFTFVAMGSYARRMAPYGTDLDLLILLEDDQDKARTDEYRKMTGKFIGTIQNKILNVVFDPIVNQGEQLAKEVYCMTWEELEHINFDRYDGVQLTAFLHWRFVSSGNRNGQEVMARLEDIKSRGRVIERFANNGKGSERAAQFRAQDLEKIMPTLLPPSLEGAFHYSPKKGNGGLKNITFFLWYLQYKLGIPNINWDSINALRGFLGALKGTEIEGYGTITQEDIDALAEANNFLIDLRSAVNLAVDAEEPYFASNESILDNVIHIGGAPTNRDTLTPGIIRQVAEIMGVEVSLLMDLIDQHTGAVIRIVQPLFKPEDYIAVIRDTMTKKLAAIFFREMGPAEEVKAEDYIDEVTISGTILSGLQTALKVKLNRLSYELERSNDIPAIRREYAAFIDLVLETMSEAFGPNPLDPKTFEPNIIVPYVLGASGNYGFNEVLPGEKLSVVIFDLTEGDLLRGYLDKFVALLDELSKIVPFLNLEIEVRGVPALGDSREMVPQELRPIKGYYNPYDEVDAAEQRARVKPMGDRVGTILRSGGKDLSAFLASCEVPGQEFSETGLRFDVTAEEALVREFMVASAITCGVDISGLTLGEIVNMLIESDFLTILEGDALTAYSELLKGVSAAALFAWSDPMREDGARRQVNNTAALLQEKITPELCEKAYKTVTSEVLADIAGTLRTDPEALEDRLKRQSENLRRILSSVRENPGVKAGVRRSSLIDPRWVSDLRNEKDNKGRTKSEVSEILKGLLKERNQAAVKALGDMDPACMDWIITPTSVSALAAKAGIDMRVAARIKKNYGSETITDGYEYSADMPDQKLKADLLAVFSKTIGQMAKALADPRKAPRCMAYVPENKRKLAEEALTEAIKASGIKGIEDRFTILNETGVPEDGMIEEVDHVVAGKLLLNYLRYKKGDIKAGEKDLDAVKTHTFDFLKYVVLNPGELTKESIDMILDGILAINFIKPIDYEEIREWKASQDAILMSL